MEPKEKDQAESAVLHLVDGPKDMRFAMTAKALVRQREEELPMHELTALNIRKVTRFRTDGEEALEAEVRRLESDKQRVAAREEDEFKNDGTQYEWVRNNKAPGMVRKRKIWSGEAGEDRFVPKPRRREQDAA